MRSSHRFAPLCIVTGLLTFLLAPLASASLYLTPNGAGLKDGSSAANALAQLTQGDQTSQAQINTVIAAYLGSSSELYKQNVGEAFDTGSFAGSYTTQFFNSAADPADATISYVSGPKILGATHLLVKDGNQSPAWYLYDITGLWDGTENIEVNNFWPARGAISHVTIYGVPGSVPEPVTLLVWGGLICAALTTSGRRWRNSCHAREEARFSDCKKV